MSYTVPIGKYVLILDTHRGIYAGVLTDVRNDERTVTLTEGRHGFRYPAGPAGERGTYSLATSGPREGARVGPKVTMTVHDVAKIVECTEEARERWEAASWT